MATADNPVRIEDVAGVRSRITWSAVVAGAILAFVINIVLTLFFASIGVSLTEAGVRANAVGWSALVAILLSIIVSLFFGGWVAAQLTAGETQREAVIYGLLTWATVVFFSMMLVGMGMRGGYFALVGGGWWHSKPRPHRTPRRGKKRPSRPARRRSRSTR